MWFMLYRFVDDWKKKPYRLGEGEENGSKFLFKGRNYRFGI